MTPGRPMTAAIVCGHIAAGEPILYAERSEPAFEEDSGWQFLCWTGVEEDEASAQIWGLAEVARIEPTVSTFLNERAGTRYVRSDAKSLWRRFPDG
jgi:hypothetical protein